LLWLMLVLNIGVARGAELPTSMLAAMLTKQSADHKFHVEDLSVSEHPVPKPGLGEVLIEMKASNINPVDHKVVEMVGRFWGYPHKLGFDVAGKVVAVGPGVSDRLKIGSEVWGEATNLGSVATTAGAYAQYAAVSESVLGLKPPSLSWVEAGALPMVALTGYDSFLWAAGGERFTGGNVTVLVLGGSGGTGHIGIQLAKAMGAKHVITTCSSKNADFVRGLGADEVIDYHTQNYWEVLAKKSVDFIYDCVGQPKTGDLAYPLLKYGGHFTTLLTAGLPSLKSRVARLDLHAKSPLCVLGCSSRERMDAISKLIEQHELKVRIDSIYALSDIVGAFNRSLSGHSAGKVVVSMSNTTRFEGELAAVLI